MAHATGSAPLTTPASIALRIAAGRLVGRYMALVDRTTRWEERGRAHVEPYLNGGGPVILAFWHGRIMLAQHGWPTGTAARPAHMLISQSKDGAVIASATQKLGFPTIRGSTAKPGKDKGGSQALRDLVRALRAGDAVAVTPDGPKGPRMRASLGTAQLAKLSGAPVIGMVWAVARAVTFDSWDRFVAPLPFGRGCFIWGAPIWIAREADNAALENGRLAIERELNRIQAEADAVFGLPTVAPAPEGEAMVAP